MTLKGEIICPQCELCLEFNNNHHFCSQCHKIYPYDDGILSFINEYVKQEGYKKNYFASLVEIEGKHFWFKARNRLILFFVKKYCQKIINDKHKMLEIGCGNGNVIYYLRKNGINCQGGDLFLEGLIYCRRKVKAPLYQIDALCLPFRNYFDIIGLFDVIEHIEEDEKVLKEVYKALKPEGNILITVPAHKKLWGRYDELAYHKRRYSRKELITKLETTGFTVEKVSYFVTLLFPALLLFRYLNHKRCKKLSNEEFLKKEIQIIPILNSVFLWILKIERILIQFINLPFGSSLIAIAKKG